MLFPKTGISHRAKGRVLLGIAATMAASCVLAGALTASASAAVSGIQPLTGTGIALNGSFVDPYPVTASSGVSQGAPVLFGTTDEVLSCLGQLRADCYTPTDLTVGYSAALSADLQAHGLTIQSSRAHHPFRMPDGTWQMAFTVGVAQTAPGTGSWNLVLHAHPVGHDNVKGIPTDWVGDSVLVGSLAQGNAGDYDGKYYWADGRLYLLYEQELSATPMRFGIAAQAMTTPQQAAASAPVTLLEPNSSSGGASLNSENYVNVSGTGGFQLVETANIIQIAGKYVMVYSTGAYNRSAYKVGLAYSDTFLPKPGTTYRKITMPDPAGVWGNPGANEVRYLLQSQEPDWPNYAAASVQAPGVGTIVNSDGHWYLFFAGYTPEEQPSATTGKFTGADRRPYFVPLEVNVPKAVTVSGATPQQLASWITVQ